MRPISSPPVPTAHAQIPKIGWDGENLQDSDFDENDTKESEKFKELNDGIFSIWFFDSNEL